MADKVIIRKRLENFNNQKMTDFYFKSFDR